jgi:SnoaL-like domain
VRPSRLPILAAIAASLCLAGAARAQEPTPPPVAKWYEALRAADRDAFAALIADDGEIELRYSGLVQSRDEFIRSLDDWAQIAKEATILTRQVSGTGASAVVEVCYRFPDAEKTNRETFTLDGDKITRVVEEVASAGCPGFQP